MTTTLKRSLSIVLLGGMAACATPKQEEISHVRVIGRDYAFGFPKTLPPGRTAFRLVNEGKVLHEMQFYRLKPGISADSALRLMVADKLEITAIDGGAGVLIAEAADSTAQELVANLKPGEVYALECAFKDAPDQPRHRDVGMLTTFEVK